MAVGRTMDVNRAKQSSVKPRIASRKFSGQEMRVTSENVEDGRIESPCAQHRSFFGDQVGQTLDDKEHDLLVLASDFAGRSLLSVVVIVAAVFNHELGQALFVHHRQMAIDFLQNYDVLQQK